MDHQSLNRRRKALCMPIECLGWRSQIPAQLVEQILSGEIVNTEYIAAIKAALGINENGSAIPPNEYRTQQALIKATKLTNLTQGSSALEGRGLTQKQYRQMVKNNMRSLMHGFDNDPYTIWAPL